MTDDTKMVVAERKDIVSDERNWWFHEGGSLKPHILERRNLVAKAWNQMGLSCSDTVDYLAEMGIEVSVNTISNDRRWLLGCWQASVQADIVEVVAREVFKLERMEAELWDQWEASKGDILKETEDQVVDRECNVHNVYKTERTGRTADYKYMDGILKCQERRAKLLGLDKAVTFESKAFNFAMFVQDAYDTARGRHEKVNQQPEPLEVQDAGRFKD